MIRAVVKDGVIQPVDPLPNEWQDGRELVVDDSPYQLGDEDLPLKDLDKWYDDLEAMVAKLDPDDIERIEATIRQADVEAKAWVRRERGLAE